MTQFSQCFYWYLLDIV